MQAVTKKGHLATELQLDTIRKFVCTPLAVGLCDTRASCRFLPQFVTKVQGLRGRVGFGRTAPFGAFVSQKSEDTFVRALEKNCCDAIGRQLQAQKDVTPEVRQTHRAGGVVHPSQVANVSQGQHTETNNHREQHTNPIAVIRQCKPPDHRSTCRRYHESVFLLSPTCRLKSFIKCRIYNSFLQSRSNDVEACVCVCVCWTWGVSLSEVDIIRVEGQQLPAGSLWVYGLLLEVSKTHTHIRSESQAPC